MEKRYNELLKVKLEQVGEIAQAMTDVDAAYLAGRLDGVIEQQSSRAAADPRKLYETEVV